MREINGIKNINCITLTGTDHGGGKIAGAINGEAGGFIKW